ncbi:DELLA protein RGL1-like [Tasmannia lanceolata]|uniref:DELLA protein RGL1-like n=1 Tax=Tasmannia lanceolata TaxID=3420 RepID=UPI004063FB5B
MANAVFPFELFDCNGFQGEGEGTRGKPSHFIETMEWEQCDYLFPDYNFYQDNSFAKGTPLSDKQFCPELVIPDDLPSDIVCATIQSFEKPAKDDEGLECYQNLCTENPDAVGPEKEKTCPISLDSVELLNSYITEYNRLDAENLNKSIKKISPLVGGGELSTEEIMRVAGARYVQLSVPTESDLLILTNPFGSMLSSLTYEEIKDVELAHLLLASAEKIGNQQYDRARNLLRQCDHLSSNAGNPVQRVVYYFAEALKERINRETGRMSSKEFMKKKRWGEDINDVMMSPHPALLACHEQLPISKVIQFTQIQAIIDNMGSAKRIHLIDFGIKIGMQWTILMQALAVRFTCPLELLKITAVVSSQDKIEETGKRLVSFAEMLNLPFTFKSVIVSDMKDLREDLFELESREVVGVYAPLVMGNMIVRPDCSEKLMKVIRNLKPSILSVSEVEANQNSLSFVNRFTESLFFYSAWFDCLETCMDRDDCNRMSIEAFFLSQGIRSTVATEGSERLIRYVGIDVWRSFFSWFGFTEIETSQKALFQANLIVNQFACGSSCTLDMNGKSLTVGWKGTPLHSVSSWKLN